MLKDPLTAMFWGACVVIALIFSVFVYYQLKEASPVDWAGSKTSENKRIGDSLLAFTTMLAFLAVAWYYSKKDKGNDDDEEENTMSLGRFVKYLGGFAYLFQVVAVALAWTLYARLYSVDKTSIGPTPVDLRPYSNIPSGFTSTAVVAVLLTSAFVASSQALETESAIEGKSAGSLLGKSVNNGLGKAFGKLKKLPESLV